MAKSHYISLEEEIRKGELRAQRAVSVAQEKKEVKAKPIYKRADFPRVINEIINHPLYKSDLDTIIKVYKKISYFRANQRIRWLNTYLLTFHDASIFSFGKFFEFLQLEYKQNPKSFSKNPELFFVEDYLGSKKINSAKIFRRIIEVMEEKGSEESNELRNGTVENAIIVLLLRRALTVSHIAILKTSSTPLELSWGLEILYNNKISTKDTQEILKKNEDIIAPKIFADFLVALHKMGIPMTQDNVELLKGGVRDSEICQSRWVRNQLLQRTRELADVIRMDPTKLRDLDYTFRNGRPTMFASSLAVTASPKENILQPFPMRLTG